MPTISFMTANYVARQVGYHMTEGWEQGDRATSAYFKPLASFRNRLDTYLSDIRAMGFAAVDLWSAILDYRWVTDEHLDIASELLDDYHLPVVSFAGWFGATAEEFERTCEIAAALDAPVLGGSTSLLKTDRGFVVDTLGKYGLRLGLENHPEKTPEELLRKLGDDEGGLIGACVDTGWFGTHGYGAAAALRRLAPRLLHVHLKDVLKPGEHETCRFGQGIVPLRACVQTLQEVGYSGAYTVEHEPELFDPTEDCIASLQMLKAWLA